MYNHVVMQQAGITSMEGKFFLEIGCGRGGGLNYIVKELQPEKTFGIDLSE